MQGWDMQPRKAEYNSYVHVSRCSSTAVGTIVMSPANKTYKQCPFGSVSDSQTVIQEYPTLAPDECEKKCDANPGCTGYVVGTTAQGCWIGGPYYAPVEHAHPEEGTGNYTTWFRLHELAPTRASCDPTTHRCIADPQGPYANMTLCSIDC